MTDPNGYLGHSQSNPMSSDPLPEGMVGRAASLIVGFTIAICLGLWVVFILAINLPLVGSMVPKPVQGSIIFIIISGGIILAVIIGDLSGCLLRDILFRSFFHKQQPS